MSTDALEPLIQEVARRTGTRLSRQQRDRLVAELTRRGALTAPREHLLHLQSSKGALELAQLLATVSVHKTDLFRDAPQLEALQRGVLEPRARQARPLHVWSAGCATGEEVATLLMLLAEAGAHPESTVLGSDLSAEALQRARRFEYAEEDLRRVPPPLLAAYVRARSLAPALQARARWLHHNLMDHPYPFAPGGQRFDLIVCRNVLIYFTAEAVRATVDAFVERLEPGGVLVLSTAEPLLEPVAGLVTLRLPGAFFYQREVAKPAPVSAAPPPPPVTSTGETPLALTPEEEGRRLFELVLEWAAEGEDHPETESGLRKALYLAPRLAGARYLLGLLLERRGQPREAQAEYRRALTLLEQNEALPSALFVNNDRLAEACRIALRRLRA